MSDNNREVQRAQIMKRMEESQVGKEILAVLRQRLETSPTLKQTLASDEFKGGEYTAERKILMSINNFGLREGVLAGMATFLVLRRGPQLIVRIVNSQSRGGGVGGSGGGYRLDKPSVSSGNSPFQQQQHRQQSNNQHSSGVTVTIMGGLKLALDVFVSMLMAATTSFSVLDENTLVKTVATLPLGEGRSVVSDEFCVTLQKEIAKRNPAIFAKADSPYLKGMHAFSQNCSRRQSYEGMLREESGMGSNNNPISIPAGGVPADYQIMLTDGTSPSGEEDDSYGASSSPNGTTDESYFSDGGGFESDNIFGDDSTNADEKRWSDSIVTDREDDQKRN